MTRHERALLRRWCRLFAYDYLAVRRLPNGVPAIVRAYADAFTSYPAPAPIGSPMHGLAGLLRPYRKPWVGA